MFVMLRRTFLAGALLALSACGGGEPDITPGSIPLSVETDIVLGSADAPVTLIEYAALTCGACGAFNNNVLSEIKPNYVDTGKLKIITREVLFVPPAEVNLAGFAMARCAGPDKYHDVLDDFFQNQTGILSAVRAGAGNQALQAVAGRHGLDKAAYDACIVDPEMEKMISEISRNASASGVSRTPTVYLNGRELTDSTALTAEGLAELLDAELTKGE